MASKSAMRTYIILVFLLCAGCAHDSDSVDNSIATIDSTRESSSVAESDDSPSASPNDEAFQHLYSDEVRTMADSLTAIHVQIESGEVVPCDTLLDRLPGSFKVFNDLYGGTMVTRGSGSNASERFVSGVIAGSYTDHWSTFEKHRNCFGQASFIKRFIVIASEGEWEADSVNFFQVLIQRRLREQPEAFCSVLPTVPRQTQVGFWYFMMDGPHPGGRGSTWALDLVREPCPVQTNRIKQAATIHASEEAPL